MKEVDSLGGQVVGTAVDHVFDQSCAEAARGRYQVLHGINVGKDWSPTLLEAVINQYFAHRRLAGVRAAGNKDTRPRPLLVEAIHPHLL